MTHLLHLFTSFMSPITQLLFLPRENVNEKRISVVFFQFHFQNKLLTFTSHNMDACRFSYISAKTNMPRTAVGINRSWDSLRVDFGRSGPGVPGATHYKTISLEGPEIFAVLDNKQVFYHDRGEW